MISSGVVPVGTTATKICTTGEGGAVLQNLSATAVSIGGPGVTSGAGVTLPAAMSLPAFYPGARPRLSVSVPSGPDDTADLYGVTAAGTSNVAYLAPQGG